MKRQLLILPIILLLLSPAFGQKIIGARVKLINEIEDKGTYAPESGCRLYMITNHMNRIRVLL
jgi:hypothetical protein